MRSSCEYVVVFDPKTKSLCVSHKGNTKEHGWIYPCYERNPSLVGYVEEPLPGIDRKKSCSNCPKDSYIPICVKKTRERAKIRFLRKLTKLHIRLDNAEKLLDTLVDLVEKKVHNTAS